MKTRIPYIIVAVSFLFTLCGCQNTQNQAQPAAEIGPSIITPENIDQLEYIERWGRGGINLAVLSDNEQYSGTVSDNDIILYDVLQDERNLDVEFDEENPKNSINPIAFSHDNRLFVYGQKDVTIWDIQKKTGKTNISLSEAANYPCYLIFDVSDRYLAIVGHGSPENGRIYEAVVSVYDLELDEIIMEAPIQYRINDDIPVPIYPTFINNNRIAFFDRDNQLIFWDLESHETIFTKMLEYPLLSISTDGLKYSVIDVENGKTSFFDLQSDIEEHSINGWGYYLPGKNDIWLAVTPFDRPHNWKVQDSNGEERCEINSLFLSIGKEVFLHDSRVYRILEDQYIETWDPVACKEIRRGVSPIHRDGLAISDDGQYLLSSNWNFANIINSADGKAVTAIPCISQDFSNAAFQLTSDSQHLAFAYPENRSHFYMLNFVDWSVEQDIELPYYEDTYRVAVSPDMKVAAISAHLGTTFWDLEKEEPYGERLSGIRAIWFSPDNTTIATVENDKLLFRDIETLEITKELLLPGEYVSLASLMTGTYDIVFNQDWTEIYVFSSDLVERWDMNGNRIRILENPMLGKEDEENPFFYCAFPVLSADDQILASYAIGRLSYKIIFWNAKSGKIIKELESSNIISGLAFDPVSARFFAENGAYIDVWGVKEN